MFKCSEHPTYTGKRVPRSECVRCYQIYQAVSGKSFGSMVLDAKSAKRSKWLESNRGNILQVATSQAAVELVSLDVAEEFVESVRGTLI